MTAWRARPDDTSVFRWFATVPARRFDLVRFFTFGYAAAWLVVRVRYGWDVAGLPDRRFEPVGVLGWLGAPPHRTIVMALWALTLVACIAVVGGRVVRISAPSAALGMLLVATLTSSFGQVFHTEHLLVLHLGILAVGCVVDDETTDGMRSAWPLNLMMAVTAVTYVIAGIAKLRWSGDEWLTGDVLRNWVAVDNLRKLLLDDLHSPIGGWLAGATWVWLPIALLTMAVEFGAPIALASGRGRLVWIAMAWAFHVGVLALMAISFPYQLFGVAYAAFLPLERVEEALRRRFRPRDRSVGSAATEPTTHDAARAGAGLGDPASPAGLGREDR